MPSRWASTCASRSAVVEQRGRRLGKVRGHQLDRAFQQHAGRLAGGVTHDAAAERVGRVPSDSRGREGRAVDPRGVHVQRIEINWPWLYAHRAPRGPGRGPSHWRPSPVRRSIPAPARRRPPDAPPLPASASPRAAPGGGSAPTSRSGCARRRSRGSPARRAARTPAFHRAPGERARQRHRPPGSGRLATTRRRPRRPVRARERVAREGSPRWRNQGSSWAKGGPAGGFHMLKTRPSEYLDWRKRREIR